MKKQVLMTTSAVFLSAALFACGASSQSTSQESISQVSSSSSLEQSSSTQTQAEFPVEITDAAGRKVVISQEPEKIVSGYYITSSMLIALGQQEKLVGIEAKADSRPIYSLSAPELLELPNVGTAKEFNLEACASLEPDLVILPIKLKNTVENLDPLGINTILVNPESMEDLNHTLTLIGEATGTSEQVQKLLDYNQSTKQELEEMLKDQEKPTVYLAGNSNYLSTAGSKMYQNSVIELAGGTNVAAELEDTYWAEISYEQLLNWNPDVIVIAPEASYTKEQLIQDTQLATLDAVKNGKVYAMPSAFEAWDSPVPSGMLGSRWLASVLYPEQYPFEKLQSDVVDFYHTFYNFEADKANITK